MRVGILGGGRWGEALARLVLAAGHDPFLAYRRGDRRPPHVLPSSDDPPKVAEACGLLIVATSAAEVRNAIRLARPSPSHRIVVAGRGIDPATSDWLTDAVLQECDAVRVGALAGLGASLIGLRYLVVHRGLRCFVREGRLRVSIDDVVTR